MQSQHHHLLFIVLFCLIVPPSLPASPVAFNRVLPPISPFQKTCLFSATSHKPSPSTTMFQFPLNFRPSYLVQKNVSTIWIDKNFAASAVTTKRQLVVVSLVACCWQKCLFYSELEEQSCNFIPWILWNSSFVTWTRFLLQHNTPNSIIYFTIALRLCQGDLKGGPGSPIFWKNKSKNQ